ncbi:MAG: integrase, partial [Gammaproteobacteria bacterium]|nr:integrase [Gammaproteobacteria bacterium]
MIKYKPKNAPWNKGKLIGQRPPLKPKEVVAIRRRLKTAKNIRELALFNLAIDSKLSGCDLVRICVKDILQDGCVTERATILQRKTQKPVQFKITEKTRVAIESLICNSKLHSQDYLFKSRLHASVHLSTRQYARTVKS